MRKADSNVALFIGAHPDDAEFLCAGTLALLHAQGWNIHIATLAPGDKGTVSHSREEISRIRQEEGRQAAAVLGGEYHCLLAEDAYIIYDRELLNRTADLVRRVRPRIVFTTPLDDYMIDHQESGKLAQTACFACGIKNLEVESEPFEPIPYLYYTDPVDLKDIYGMPVTPGMWVDISSVIETKLEMLARHASQREWLLAHHGIDEYTNAMKQTGAQRGEQVQVAYAEGFRQHLGHSFPQDNLLQAELGERVIVH